MSPATPPTPPSPPSAKSPSRARVWAGRVAAIVTVVLFGWGSLLLADWLHDRGQVGRGFEAAHGGAGRVAFPAAPRDPRMDVWLDRRVTWAPRRRVSFGKDAAIVSTGTSADGPAEVFHRRLLAVADSAHKEALEAVKAGPSAALALRLNATVSNGPICASLVRLPPDVTSPKGTLKTEAGVVMLAFKGHGRWEYVTFWFPDGLDLTALVKDAPPATQVLAELGPEAERSFVPTLVLGGEGATQGSKTVLCRANGPAGTAIDRVAASMSKSGWRDVEGDLTEKTPGARVLTGPNGTVWMATTDGERADGLVTVLVEAP